VAVKDVWGGSQEDLLYFDLHLYNVNVTIECDWLQTPSPFGLLMDVIGFRSCLGKGSGVGVEEGGRGSGNTGPGAH
jgi:hypothetical protein